MPILIKIIRMHYFKRLNTTLPCFRWQRKSLSTDVLPEETPVPSGGTKKHLKEINKFFTTHPSVTRYKSRIPKKYIESKSRKHPETLYLICPMVARSIADHVCERLDGSDNIVAETRAGLGLIGNCLLQKGISQVRLYEGNREFYSYLSEVHKDGPATVHDRDFFDAWRYAYLDNQDQGHRLANLFKGLPKKDWNNAPFMTVIGTMTHYHFLKYLVTCLALQKEPMSFGRLDLFIITYQRLGMYFTATAESASFLYKYWTILLQLFFEAEIIDKYSRKFFLPWEYEQKSRFRESQDQDNLYLLHVKIRKELPILANQFVPFYCFMKVLYGNGLPAIIPTCEKWVPGCGVNLIIPKLRHEDYFEDISVFTQFKELNPKQIVGIYRELSLHPNYASSPFMDMVEQDWLKSETIKTELNELNMKDKKT